MKEKQAKKQIDIKDLTSSPFFVIGLMSFVCIVITALLVLVMMDISKTKTEITQAQILYQQNLNKVTNLKEIKAKSEKTKEQLEECKDVLPDSLGDVYTLQESVISKCDAFGLSIVSIDYTTATKETQEVVFNISVAGSFEAIYDFMNYYSNLEQIHRFDSLALTRGTDGSYSATLSLAILSEQGAEGAVNAAELASSEAAA